MMGFMLGCAFGEGWNTKLAPEQVVCFGSIVAQDIVDIFGNKFVSAIPFIYLPFYHADVWVTN